MTFTDPASRRRPPDLSEERAFQARLGAWPMGIDEAGRGPWAGPVVAAAVRLDPARVPEGLDDSKRLSPKRRRALDAAVRAVAAVGVGAAAAREVDRLGLHRATFLAMERAAARVGGGPALVDGRFVPPGVRGVALVKGDTRSASIAAASIVAKVLRDRIMVALAARHPAYDWGRNVGYGTAGHRLALAQHGVTPHHRRSFRPIHNILCPENA